MKLWDKACGIINGLRDSCSNNRTFIWLFIVIIGFMIKTDFLGVTSFIRYLGIHPKHYYALLHFFYSKAISIDYLTLCWIKIVFTVLDPYLYKVNGDVILIVDAIKIAKEGQKMPAVKKLHQESNNNLKSPYIMGHYVECISILSIKFAIPILARITSGLWFLQNYDPDKNLIDQFLDLLNKFLPDVKCYIIGDNYYNVKRVIEYMEKKDKHLITRMRSNSVAWEPYIEDRSKHHKGRCKLYGNKIHVKDFFGKKDDFKKAKLLLYGEREVTVQYQYHDLVLRPHAVRVRIVTVIHPAGGITTLLSSDITLDPLKIIELYAKRFKIEVTFKSLTQTNGLNQYHFWSNAMKKVNRFQNKKELAAIEGETKEKAREKMEQTYNATTLFIQLCLISEGILQMLSIFFRKNIWKDFKGWYRTMNKKSFPSERVVSDVLRHSLIPFLGVLKKTEIFKKYMLKKINVKRMSWVIWHNRK